MKIGKVVNYISCEYKMQDIFEKWLQRKGLKYKRECRTPSRRADFLILKERRLINVEAKCTAIDKLFQQLEDHSKYCNYCFAFIPSFALTLVWFKKRLVEKGFGLIIYDYDNENIVECLEAHLNTGLEKQTRKNLIEKIIANG